MLFEQIKFQIKFNYIFRYIKIFKKIICNIRGVDRLPASPTIEQESNVVLSVFRQVSTTDNNSYSAQWPTRSATLITPNHLTKFNLYSLFPTAHFGAA